MCTGTHRRLCADVPPVQHFSIPIILNFTYNRFVNDRITDTGSEQVSDDHSQPGDGPGFWRRQWRDPGGKVHILGTVTVSHLGGAIFVGLGLLSEGEDRTYGLTGGAFIYVSGLAIGGLSLVLKDLDDTGKGNRVRRALNGQGWTRRSDSSGEDADQTD